MNENEWLVNAVMAMYEGAHAQTVVRTADSKAFNVKIGLHQGSVLSPLLFVMVMEIITREQLWHKIRVIANSFLIYTLQCM